MNKAATRTFSFLAKYLLAGAMIFSVMQAQAVITVDPEYTFEFNTYGDLEGWEAIADGFNSLANGIIITGAVNEAEIVLTASNGVTSIDPGLLYNGDALVLGSGRRWDELKIRLRQVNASGNPLPFNDAGVHFQVNGTSLMPYFGPALESEATGGWMNITLPLHDIGTNDITYLRVDPTGNNYAFNFEIDSLSITAGAAASTVTADPDYTFEFNTFGDKEGWYGNQTATLRVTNAVTGSEVVLTTPDVTGADPQLWQEVIAVEPASNRYWSTMEVRLRQLDSSGNPATWSFNGFVIFANAVGGSSASINPEGAGEWVVTTLDITGLGNDTITSLRLDPVGNDDTLGFEVDYVKLTTGDTAPVIPVANPAYTWDFNTLGDTEGWIGNAQLSGLDSVAAVSGPESVLRVADVTGLDPNIGYSRGVKSEGRYWWDLKIRMRHLDSENNPLAYIKSGTYFAVNNTPLAANVASEGSGEWVVITCDMAAIGTADIGTLRIDPVGNATDKNFEIDTIQVSTLSYPRTTADVASFEFNTPGDVEGWSGNAGLDPLLISSSVNGGSESVLTTTDVTGLDPQLSFANTVSSAGRDWDKVAIRMRLLTGETNPVGYVASGTLLIINGNLMQPINAAGGFSVDTGSNGWIVASHDIGFLGQNDITSMRLDPVGNDPAKTFEIDYIRFSGKGDAFDGWASLYNIPDGDTGRSDDPDLDTFDNYYEYVYGGNPTNPADTGILPRLETVTVGGTNYADYIYYNRSSPASGLSYDMEVKGNLQFDPIWVESTNHIVVGVGMADDDGVMTTNRTEVIDPIKYFSLDVTED